MRILGLSLICAFLCAPTDAVAQKKKTKLAALNRFDGAIAKFEKEDLAKPFPTGEIVFTGSSSVRRWSNLDRAFPKLKTLNRGFGGSTLPEVNHYLQRIVLKHKPRAVVIFCGSNDLAQGHSPELVLKNFRTFASKIHAELPETEIYYLAIHLPPGRVKFADRIKKTNDLIAKECGKNKLLTFVDVHAVMLGEDGNPDASLYADPLHPTLAAYERWTKLLRPLLK